MLKPLYCSKEKINKYSTNHTKSEKEKKVEYETRSNRPLKQITTRVEGRPRLPMRQTERKSCPYNLQQLQGNFEPTIPEFIYFSIKNR